MATDLERINSIRATLNELESSAKFTRDARIDRSQLVMVLANLVNHSPPPRDGQEEYEAAIESARAVLKEVHGNKMKQLEAPATF